MDLIRSSEYYMTENERRHYQRIPFIADVLLGLNDQKWNCQLEDISLKGVLIKSPEDVVPKMDTIYDVTLVLGHEATIDMHAIISHTKSGYWGMHWQNIDIECFTHLRRLLELDTQDPEIVHRALSELKTVSEG